MRIGISVACILLFSCSKKDAVPSEFIQPAKMQTALWDFMRADAVTTYRMKGFGSPEAWNDNIELQQQIFAIHKITKEQFYKSLNYYLSKPKIFQPMLDSLVAKANRERTTFKTAPEK
jgi:hypothetical protein